MKKYTGLWRWDHFRACDAKEIGACGANDIPPGLRRKKSPGLRRQNSPGLRRKKNRACGAKQSDKQRAPRIRGTRHSA